MASNIAAAVAAGEFCVHYQPRFSLKSRLPVSAEALVRWRTRPDCQPGIFIPEMERSGCIEALTMFVTNKVCEAILHLESTFGFSPKISINIAPTLFRDDSFVVRVQDTVAAHGVHPSKIEMEITESSVLHDFDAVVSSAANLRAAGFDLALDDFGTGLSSLHYLDLIPASTIKIDRHFIWGVGARKTCNVIVSSVASLARDTGMISVAEGVETNSQLDYISRLGYDEAQGFLLAKPMPFSEFKAFIATHHPHPQRQAEPAQPHSHFPQGC